MRAVFRSAVLAMVMLFTVSTLPVFAACTGVVAERGARVWQAAAGEKAAAITYLGHASFLIESPEGVRIVTDYNGVHRAKVTPDIVTMNNAHQTHYTDVIEPGVKFVLRGWDPGGGVANHHLQYRDVRVNNVPTNVRGFGGTRYNGNSIFVFDLADLCIAHLGHLHHTLTQADLAELGTIDIVLVPVDGSFTLNQPEMIEVLRQLKAKIAIPMHVFTEATLARFLALAGERGFDIRHMPEPHIPSRAAICRSGRRSLYCRGDMPGKGGLLEMVIFIKVLLIIANRGGSAMDGEIWLRVAAVIGAVAHIGFAYKETLGWGPVFVAKAAPAWVDHLPCRTAVACNGGFYRLGKTPRHECGDIQSGACDRPPLGRSRRRERGGFARNISGYMAAGSGGGALARLRYTPPLSHKDCLG